MDKKATERERWKRNSYKLRKLMSTKIKKTKNKTWPKSYPEK